MPVQIGRLLAGLWLLAGALDHAVLAANASPAPAPPRELRALLALDASGKVTDLQLLDAPVAPVEQAIRQQVKDWVFAPSKKDGRAVASRVQIGLPIRLRPAPEGNGVIVQVDDPVFYRVSTAFAPVPEYPERSYERAHRGHLVAELDVSADGTVSDVRVIEQKTIDGDMLRSAVDTLKTWRFTLDEVDGQPVPTKVRVPVAFGEHAPDTNIDFVPDSAIQGPSVAN